MLREAVKMLTAKGLLMGRKRAGTLVQPEDHWNLLDPDVLRWMLQRKFSIDLLIDFTEIRMSIEPRAASLAAHSASGPQRRAISDAIDRHRNILIIGGTGSGKTTLVNAIINGMVETDPTERLVIIEDTGEIQCAAENYVQFHTSPQVSMTALLKTTLRMRPDRILVGEVRGPEALDLLMAWNTGHEGGAATLHANNAEAGLTRLALLISMHPDSPRPIEPLIGDAVHLIVHIARTPEGRRIESILEVEGYADGKYRLRSM